MKENGDTLLLSAPDDTSKDLNTYLHAERNNAAVHPKLNHALLRICGVDLILLTREGKKRRYAEETAIPMKTAAATVRTSERQQNRVPSATSTNPWSRNFVDERKNVATYQTRGKLVSCCQEIKRPMLQPRVERQRDRVKHRRH